MLSGWKTIITRLHGGTTAFENVTAVEMAREVAFDNWCYQFVWLSIIGGPFCAWAENFLRIKSPMSMERVNGKERNRMAVY